MAKKVVLAGACRTAIGKMGGQFGNTPAVELGSVHRTSVSAFLFSSSMVPRSSG